MILPNKNEIHFSYTHGIPHGNAIEDFPKGSANFTLAHGKIAYPIQFYSNL